MNQYIEAKEQHPDAVLLLRVDNFYETFSDDAVAAGEITGNGARQCDRLSTVPNVSAQRL